ncbi:MAG: DUF262 domain-containing protein [Bacteroidetes bacterium]|nr:DUF262 domain-containing protein [Bacteroidota bacterium]
MGLQTLGQILSNRIIRIPDFQRGYSWEEKHIEALWNDINNIAEPNLHFLGVVTFQNVLEEELEKFKLEIQDPDITWFYDNDRALITINNTNYCLNYIIDGQQRITSLMILWKAISNRFYTLGKNHKASEIDSKYLFAETTSEDSVYRFGYSANIPCYSWYKGNILDDEKFKDLELETFYTTRLKKSKDYFEEKLKQFNEPQLIYLVEKIEKYIKINVYELEKELDVSLVFETMNNRGKPLSNLEILKNRLIYLVKVNNLIYKDINLHDKIIETWKFIYENLGKNKNRILDDDEFLRAHWIMYFNHNDRNDSDFKRHKDFLFDEHFIKNNTEINGYEINKYCDSMKQSVCHWEKFKNNSFTEDWSRELLIWNEKLDRIPASYGKFFEPLILAVLYHLYNEDDIADLVLVFKQIEKHNFIVYLISCHNSNQNRAFFYKKANQVYIIKQQAYALGTADSDIAKKTRTCQNIEMFKNEIIENNEHYFFDWIGIKYFLTEYEISLNSSFKYLASKFSVTTIYTDDIKCNWEGFKQDKKGNNIGQENKKKLKYTLGNLVLCEKRNDNNFNANFKQRCYVQLNNSRTFGLATGIENELEVAKNDNWFPTSIYDRSLKFLSFLNERWNLQIPETRFLQIILPNMNIENFH